MGITASAVSADNDMPQPALNTTSIQWILAQCETLHQPTSRKHSTHCENDEISLLSNKLKLRRITIANFATKLEHHDRLTCGLVLQDSQQELLSRQRVYLAQIAEAVSTTSHDGLGYLDIAEIQRHTLQRIARAVLFENQRVRNIAVTCARPKKRPRLPLRHQSMVNDVTDTSTTVLLILLETYLGNDTSTNMLMQTTRTIIAALRQYIKVRVDRSLDNRPSFTVSTLLQSTSKYLLRSLDTLLKTKEGKESQEKQERQNQLADAVLEVLIEMAWLQGSTTSLLEIARLLFFHGCHRHTSCRQPKSRQSLQQKIDMTEAKETKRPALVVSCTPDLLQGTWMLLLTGLERVQSAVSSSVEIASPGLTLGITSNEEKVETRAVETKEEIKTFPVTTVTETQYAHQTATVAHQTATVLEWENSANHMKSEKHKTNASMVSDGDFLWIHISGDHNARNGIHKIGTGRGTTRVGKEYNCVRKQNRDHSEGELLQLVMVNHELWCYDASHDEFGPYFQTKVVEQEDTKHAATKHMVLENFAHHCPARITSGGGKVLVLSFPSQSEPLQVDIYDAAALQLSCVLLSSSSSIVSRQVVLQKEQQGHYSTTTKVIFALNCGGGHHIAPDGVEYEPDDLYLVAVGAEDVSIATTKQTVRGAGDQILYGTSRISEDGDTPFHYVLPTKKEEGWHKVRLRFVELHHDREDASRFHIICNGATVHRNLDVHAHCGGIRTSPSSSEITFDVMVEEGSVVLGFGHNENLRAKKSSCLRPQVSTVILEEYLGQRHERGNNNLNIPWKIMDTNLPAAEWIDTTSILTHDGRTIEINALHQKDHFITSNTFDLNENVSGQHLRTAFASEKNVAMCHDTINHVRWTYDSSTGALQRYGILGRSNVASETKFLNNSIALSLIKWLHIRALPYGPTSMDSSSFDSLKDPLFTHLSKKSGKWLRYEGSEKALHALSDLLEQWIIGLGSREGGSSSELCVHLLNILLVTVHRMPKDDAKDEKTAEKTAENLEKEREKKQRNPIATGKYGGVFNRLNASLMTIVRSNYACDNARRISCCVLTTGMEYFYSTPLSQAMVLVSLLKETRSTKDNQMVPGGIFASVLLKHLMSKFVEQSSIIMLLDKYYVMGNSDLDKGFDDLLQQLWLHVYEDSLPKSMKGADIQESTWAPRAFNLLLLINAQVYSRAAASSASSTMTKMMTTCARYALKHSSDFCRAWAKEKRIPVDLVLPTSLLSFVHYTLVVLSNCKPRAMEVQWIVKDITTLCKEVWMLLCTLEPTHACVSLLQKILYAGGWSGGALGHMLLCGAKPSMEEDAESRWLTSKLFSCGLVVNNAVSSTVVKDGEDKEEEKEGKEDQINRSFLQEIVENSSMELLESMRENTKTNALLRRLAKHHRESSTGRCVRASFAAMLYHTGSVSVACSFQQLLVKKQAGSLVLAPQLNQPKQPLQQPPKELTVLWERSFRFYEYVGIARGAMGTTMDLVARRITSRSLFLLKVQPHPNDQDNKDKLKMASLVEKYLRSPTTDVEMLEAALQSRCIRAKNRALGFKICTNMLSSLLDMKDNSNTLNSTTVKSSTINCALRWWGVSNISSRASGDGGGRPWSISSHLTSAPVEYVNACHINYSLLFATVVPLLEETLSSVHALDVLCVTDAEPMSILNGKLIETLSEYGSMPSATRIFLVNNAVEARAKQAMLGFLSTSALLRTENTSMLPLIMKSISDNFHRLYMRVKEAEDKLGMKYRCIESRVDSDSAGESGGGSRGGMYHPLVDVHLTDSFVFSCVLSAVPSLSSLNNNNLQTQHCYNMIRIGTMDASLIKIDYILPKENSKNDDNGINIDSAHLKITVSDVGLDGKYHEIELKFGNAPLRVVLKQWCHITIVCINTTAGTTQDGSRLWRASVHDLYTGKESTAEKRTKLPQRKNKARPLVVDTMNGNYSLSKWVKWVGQLSLKKYEFTDSNKSLIKKDLVGKLRFTLPTFDPTRTIKERKEIVLNLQWCLCQLHGALSSTSAAQLLKLHPHIVELLCQMMDDGKNCWTICGNMTVQLRILRTMRLIFALSTSDKLLSTGFRLRNCRVVPYLLREASHSIRHHLPLCVDVVKVTRDGIGQDLNDEVGVIDINKTCVSGDADDLSYVDPELQNLRGEELILLVRFLLSGACGEAWHADASKAVVNCLALLPGVLKSLRCSSNERVDDFWYVSVGLAVLGGRTGGLRLGALCTTISGGTEHVVVDTCSTYLTMKEKVNIAPLRMDQHQEENVSDWIKTKSADELTGWTDFVGSVNFKLDSITALSFADALAEKAEQVDKVNDTIDIDTNVLNDDVGSSNVTLSLLRCSVALALESLLVSATNITAYMKLPHALVRMVKSCIRPLESTGSSEENRPLRGLAKQRKVLQRMRWSSLLPSTADNSTSRIDDLNISTFETLHLHGVVMNSTSKLIIVNAKYASEERWIKHGWKCANCWSFVRGAKKSNIPMNKFTFTCDVCGHKIKTEKKSSSMHIGKLVGKPWTVIKIFETGRNSYIPDGGDNVETKSGALDQWNESIPNWSVPSLGLQPIRKTSAMWYARRGYGIRWVGSKSEGGSIHHQQQQRFFECRNDYDLKQRSDELRKMLALGVDNPQRMHTLPPRAPTRVQYYEVRVEALDDDKNDNNDDNDDNDDNAKEMCIAVGVAERTQAHQSESAWNPLSCPTSKTTLAGNPPVPFTVSYKNNGSMSCTYEDTDRERYVQRSIRHQMIWCTKEKPPDLVITKGMIVHCCSSKPVYCRIKECHVNLSTGGKWYFRVRVIVGAPHMNGSMKIGWCPWENHPTTEESYNEQDDDDARKTTVKQSEEKKFNNLGKCLPVKGTFISSSIKSSDLQLRAQEYHKIPLQEQRQSGSDHYVSSTFGATGDIITVGIDVEKRIMSYSSLTKNNPEKIVPLAYYADVSSSYKNRNFMVPVLSISKGCSLEVLEEEQIVPLQSNKQDAACWRHIFSFLVEDMTTIFQQQLICSCHTFRTSLLSLKNPYYRPFVVKRNASACLRIPEEYNVEFNNTQEDNDKGEVSTMMKQHLLQMSQLPSYQVNDVVGVGWDALTRTLYMTLNGKLLENSRVLTMKNVTQLRPTIWMKGTAKISLIDKKQHLYTKHRKESVVSSLPIDTVLLQPGAKHSGILYHYPTHRRNISSNIFLQSVHAQRLPCCISLHSLGGSISGDVSSSSSVHLDVSFPTLNNVRLHFHDVIIYRQALLCRNSMLLSAGQSAASARKGVATAKGVGSISVDEGDQERISFLIHHVLGQTESHELYVKLVKRAVVKGKMEEEGKEGNDVPRTKLHGYMSHDGCRGRLIYLSCESDSILEINSKMNISSISSTFGEENSTWRTTTVATTTNTSMLEDSVSLNYVVAGSNDANDVTTDTAATNVGVGAAAATVNNNIDTSTTVMKVKGPVLTVFGRGNISSANNNRDKNEKDNNKEKRKVHRATASFVVGSMARSGPIYASVVKWRYDVTGMAEEMRFGVVLDSVTEYENDDDDDNDSDEEGGGNGDGDHKRMKRSKRNKRNKKKNMNKKNNKSGNDVTVPTVPTTTATATASVVGHLGTDNYSWGMDVNCMLTTHGRSTAWFNAKVEGLSKNDLKTHSYKSARVRLRSGDTIECALNSSIGSLSYCVNGINYGVAFLDTRLRGSTRVRPAISLSATTPSSNVQIRISRIHPHHTSSHYESYEWTVRSAANVLGLPTTQDFVTLLRSVGGDITKAVQKSLTLNKTSQNLNQKLNQQFKSLEKEKTHSYPRGLLLQRDETVMSSRTASEAGKYAARQHQQHIATVTNKITSIRAVANTTAVAAVAASTATTTTTTTTTAATIGNMNEIDQKIDLFTVCLDGCSADSTEIVLQSQIMYTSTVVAVQALRRTLLRMLVQRSRDVPMSLASLGGLGVLRSLLLIIAPRYSMNHGSSQYSQHGQQSLSGASKNLLLKKEETSDSEALLSLRPLLLSLLCHDTEGESLRTFLLSECVAHLLSAAHPTQIDHQWYVYLVILVISCYFLLFLIISCCIMLFSHKFAAFDIDNC